MGNARREEADGGVHFVLGHAGPQLVSMSPGPPQRKPRRKIPAEKTRSAQRWEPHPQTAQPDTQRGPWAEGSVADVEERIYNLGLRRQLYRKYYKIYY